MGASARDLRKRTAQPAGMKDHVAGGEATVEVPRLPTKELPRACEHRFASVSRR